MSKMDNGRTIVPPMSPYYVVASPRSIMPIEVGAEYDLEVIASLLSSAVDSFTDARTLPFGYIVSLVWIVRRDHQNGISILCST